MTSGNERQLCSALGSKVLEAAIMGVRVLVDAFQVITGKKKKDRDTQSDSYEGDQCSSSS